MGPQLHFTRFCCHSDAPVLAVPAADQCHVLSIIIFFSKHGYRLDLQTLICTLSEIVMGASDSSPIMPAPSRAAWQEGLKELSIFSLQSTSGIKK